MKKLICLIVSALLLISLMGCAASKKESPAKLAEEIAEAELLGDTLSSAYEQGWAYDWLDLYFMGNSDENSERRAEVEEMYPTNDALLYGIDYESASEAGWGYIWDAVHSDIWGASDYRYGNSSAPNSYGNQEAETISDSQVQKINEVQVVQLALQWKNENNYSLPSSSKITTTRAKTMLTEYRYSGSVVTAVTEVEYWFGGGTPDGSVYATVVIDLYTGDVLSASIG